MLRHQPRRGKEARVLYAVLACLLLSLVTAGFWLTTTSSSSSSTQQPEPPIKSSSSLLQAIEEPLKSATSPQQVQVVASSSSSPPRLLHHTTIVTCFFDLAKRGQKTKYDPDFYLRAASNGTLTIKSPMVIFTDSPDAVRKFRGHEELTLIVHVELDDFETYKQYFSLIQQRFPRDREGVTSNYSPLLFTVYHAKAECVKRAIALDHFNTDHYLYMDIGCIRDHSGIGAGDFIDKPFPRHHRQWLVGREDRVQMQAVAGRNGPCATSVRWIDAERPERVPDVPAERKVKDIADVPQQPYQWWIAGALFSGNKKSLLAYYEVYMLELGRFLAADHAKYSLIDQYLMGALACRYDLIEVVRPPVPCCANMLSRTWFFMLMFYVDDFYPQGAYSMDDELTARRAAELKGLPLPPGSGVRYDF